MVLSLIQRVLPKEKTGAPGESPALFLCVRGMERLTTGASPAPTSPPKSRPNVGEGLAPPALRLLSSGVGEAAEEVISGAVEPALEMILDGKAGYGRDTAAALAQSALVGGILGALGGGVQLGKDAARSVSQYTGAQYNDPLGQGKKQQLQDLEVPIQESIDIADNSDIISGKDESQSSEFSSVGSKGAEADTIQTRSAVRLQHGFSAFPENDVLAMNARRIRPSKGCYDVALHGTPSAVCFGSTVGNMDARALAAFIRHRSDYRGEAIRLFACNTGKRNGSSEYCFAEELANALGTVVYAPDDYLYITVDGRYYIGTTRNTKLTAFYPNERRRLK